MSTTAAQYPAQAAPIFSSRQYETPEAGQVLTLNVYFPDGSHDSESERLADYGNFVPSEDATAAEERLQRTLRRRNREKFGGTP